MKLLIDIGNTLIKTAICDEDQIVARKSYEVFSVNELKSLLSEYPVLLVAVSSVRLDNKELDDYLKECFGEKYIKFSSQTKIPITNRYKTPDTLGQDRLLAAVAANSIYPQQSVLVIDVGSAITFDFISSDNSFMGGTISPGLRFRLRSLNDFTEKLPLCNISEENTLFATETIAAIESGVMNSVLFEIEGYIEKYREIYGDIKIVLTGGDSKYFENRLKNTIFAEYELIFKGLNRVITYNEL